MPLPFATYDVFTDARFAGIPLAAVFEADGSRRPRNDLRRGDGEAKAHGAQDAEEYRQSWIACNAQRSIKRFA
jgi:hypothetical protein